MTGTSTLVATIKARRQFGNASHRGFTCNATDLKIYSYISLFFRKYIFMNKLRIFPNKGGETRFGKRASSWTTQIHWR